MNVRAHTVDDAAEVFGPADLALEAGRLGTWHWDLTTGTVRWDRSLLRVFGLTSQTAPTTSDEYSELVHPDDRAAVAAAAEQALGGGGVREMEHRLLLPDGEVRWVSVSSRVVSDPQGMPIAFVGVTVDVTERKLAEERLAFLSRAGQVLGSSLDADTTFQQLAELAVERLADWCTIELLEDDTVRLVALSHRDPEKISYARRLRERFPVNLDDDEQGLPHVLKTGEPEFTPDIDEELIRTALAAVGEFTAEDVEEFVGLGLRSSLVVPLCTPGGRVLGGLTLVAEEGRRRYEDEDVALAMQVASRAAVAVENAQLYARIEHAAVTLQRSLLPAELPTLPFAELGRAVPPAQCPRVGRR